MATKLKPWAFLIWGVFSLLRAWERWNEQPLKVMFYVSLVSGVMFTTLGVLAFRARSKNQIKPAEQAPALDARQ